MITPKIWYVNVFVSDLARSVAFYRDSLGLALHFEHAEFGYASFVSDGIGLGLACIDANAPEFATLVGRQTGVGFGVPDVDAAHRELVAKGVRFTMEPSRQPWGGYMALFADPDGNTYYLDQLHERGAAATAQQGKS